MKIERLADGLGAAEGPAFLPDGRFICVEIWKSRISVWTEEDGLQEHVHVGGGCRGRLGARPSHDGGFSSTSAR